MSIAENLHTIQKQIAEACTAYTRNPDDVKLVAVSKTKPEQMIVDAYNAGQRDFGENYIQELHGKIQHLELDGIRWHFIGQLQSNKVKFIVPGVWLIHTLDSLSSAKEIQKHASKANIIQHVLIQVNISDEQQKGGVSADELPQFAVQISQMDNIKVDGLMGIPPLTAVGDEALPYFYKLCDLADHLPDGVGRLLSMGMTHDFLQAINAGANYIRIGTAIFGARQYNQ